MLSEHFNGHVRYGAAMALGIACSGSGYKVNSSVLYIIKFRRQLHCSSRSFQLRRISSGKVLWSLYPLFLFNNRSLHAPKWPISAKLLWRWSSRKEKILSLRFVHILPTYYCLVRSYPSAGNPRRWWPQCNHLITQSKRSPGYGQHDWYIRFSTALVLAFVLPFYFVSFPAHMFNWPKQGVAGLLSCSLFDFNFVDA